MVDAGDEIVLTPKAASNCCPKAFVASREHAKTRTKTTVNFFTFFSIDCGVHTLDVRPARWVGFTVLTFCMQNSITTSVSAVCMAIQPLYNHKTWPAANDKECSNTANGIRLFTILIPKTCGSGKSCVFEVNPSTMTKVTRDILANPRG
jgi:hypothetical protein